MDPVQTKIHPFKRDKFTELLGKKGLNYGVEIGTCWGKYARKLCQGNPNLKLVTIDPYRIMYADDWTQRIGQKDLDNVRAKAKKVTHPFNITMLRKTSMEALPDFDNESLDFVYIDGSHEFDYVATDLVEWGRKVRKGGIISGHDYNLVDVRLIVDAYAKAHFVPKINLTDEKSHTWWFERTW